jgi:uncharacterized membrane protein
MESFFFHPRTVHIALGLAPVIPFLAILVLLLARRNFRATWLVVVALQAALSAGAFVAVNTGEREEERVERIVGEEALHEHEEAGEMFAWSSLAVLALSALALIRRERAARVLAFTATAGAFAVLGLGIRAGSLGGDLVYEHGAARAYEQTAHPRAAAEEAKPMDIER